MVGQGASLLRVNCNAYYGLIKPSVNGNDNCVAIDNWCAIVLLLESVVRRLKEMKGKKLWIGARG